MDPFLDPDFLKRHWDEIRDAPWWLILPLLALAAFGGWKLKDKMDDGEIRGVKAERDALRAERDVYKTRLEFVGDKSANNSQEFAALQQDTATLRRDIEGLKDQIKDQANLRALASALAELATDAERRAITLTSTNNEIREVVSAPTGIIKRS